MGREDLWELADEQLSPCSDGNVALRVQDALESSASVGGTDTGHHDVCSEKAGYTLGAR